MVMSDDEQALERHAATLARLLSEAIPGWVRWAIAQRVAIESPEHLALVEQAAAQAQSDLKPQLHNLLSLDIDQQTTTPLTVARGAVVHASSVLETLGVAPVERDEHARRLHPDDVYDLAPGGFLDFGDEVQAAGLTWGAAKAYVHKQRRRALDEAANVVAVAPNLMDQSRFASATVVSTATAAHEASPSLLLVDVDRVDDLGSFVSDQFPTIGFGSHVDEARLEAARKAGFAEALPRSVFFKRLPSLLDPSGSSRGDHQ